MERNIRLIVAYDGTDLHGYQRQENGMTVQEALETALSKVCNEKVTVYGSSRTDSGVHARYQVVTFFTKGSIPAKNLTRALIAHLPKSIVVTEASEVPIDWRVRHHNFGKKYIYTIYNHEIADPIRQRYHWHVKKPLDLNKMRAAAKIILGKHNFTTFAGKNSTPQDPNKTIYAVEILEINGQIELHVIGDGFLYHMVRNIAGMLVDVGLGRMTLDKVEEALAAQNRTLLGKTAPAQGLCLEKVYFTQTEREKDINEY